MEEENHCFLALEKQWNDVKQKNEREIEQAFREEDLTLPRGLV